MKKLMTLMIAAVMLLGCMNVTAYADDAHKGTTTITATVAAVAYEIVIPSSVDMTAPGVLEVAEPSVKNVSNAIDKTVISYTATGTDFTLSGGSGTMTAAYYSDLAGTTPFPTTPVEVYKNNALVSPLQKIYVGVTEDDWYAATPGTYTATINFDFNSSNNTNITISSILNTVPSGFPIGFANGWPSVTGNYKCYQRDGLLAWAGAAEFGNISIATDLTQIDSNTYEVTINPSWRFVFTFRLASGVLSEIQIQEYNNSGIVRDNTFRPQS